MDVAMKLLVDLSSVAGTEKNSLPPLAIFKVTIANGDVRSSHFARGQHRLLVNGSLDLTTGILAKTNSKIMFQAADGCYHGEFKVSHIAKMFHVNY